jgi:hypothetical protein
MVIMTLLGIPFLLMGETENRIAENERLALQAQYAAESTARMVKRWFDYPMHATNAINAPLEAIDRSQRLIDEDGDPATDPVPADGSSDYPYYKQYTDAVFAEPYSGSLADKLLGTPEGPDMVIDAGLSADAEAFLDDLSMKLFDVFPGKGRRAKISRIEVYAPPTHFKAGSWVRYGVGTAEVLAGIYQQDGDGERRLSERQVRFVFNEIPYVQESKRLGALHSCRSLYWSHAFNVHWGVVTSRVHVYLDDDLPHKYPAGLARTTSTALHYDRLWGWNDGALFGAYKDAIEDAPIEDPWLRVLAGDDIDEYESSWPFSWTGTPPLGSGQLTWHDGTNDGSHSGYRENALSALESRFGPGACPSFPYASWKAIARSGGPNVHYYSYQGGGTFREHGTGQEGDFRDLTNGRTGIFFFDTEDGAPPLDTDDDGRYENLTPSIYVEGGSWSVRGFVFLNAESFSVRGAIGQLVELRPPGEPFQDEDSNGRFDAGEDWINLAYPGVLGSTIWADADGTIGGDTVWDPAWNDRGPALEGSVNLQGILYTNGKFDSTGPAVHYGSVVAHERVETSETPYPADIYWDQDLRGAWPPPEWGLPRVMVTEWAAGL